MCQRCHYSGAVVATHRENGGIYAFRCGCGAAERRGLAQNIPTWQNSNLKDYQVDFTIQDYKVAKANPKDVIEDEDIPF